MNKKATYEITITDKLGQLPLPALEDAIWARIERDLDLEIPTDDGPGSDGGGPVKPPSSGQFPLHFGLSAFLLALITFYFLSQNKQQPTNYIPVTSQPTIQTLEQDRLPDKETKANIPPGFKPPPNNARDIFSPPLVDSGQLQGEENILVIPPPVEIATTRTTAPPVAGPVVDSLVPMKKKGKGVSGLTDDDYRIVPARKDSSE